MAPLGPDTADVESASPASCVSWVASFASPASCASWVVSPASCASWVTWQRPLKFHASGAKLLHDIPSWHIRQSNSASCASRLVPQNYCSSWFTTERCSPQGYHWAFLGIVHHGFSALSLMHLASHTTRQTILSPSPSTAIFPGILHYTSLQLHIQS